MNYALKYPKEGYALTESIDPEEFIVATYYMCGNPEDYLSKAYALAFEQTTGAFVPGSKQRPKVGRKPSGKGVGVYELGLLSEETPEVRRKHSGKVVGVYELGLPDKETGNRNFLLRIAFPFVNIGYQIPELLSTVFGNIAFSGNLKLVDLDFPESFTEHFNGPKFGVEGVRKILKVWDRPLAMTMVKPCTGIPPSTVAKLFYEATRGGIDIVKDDELMADPSFCTFKDRLKAVLEAQKKVEDETGEKKLYAVNVTDEVNVMIEKAHWAIENGANCMMVNAFATGISAMRVLAEDPQINIPLLAHPCLAGAYYGSSLTGISFPLLFGKFMRLAGADMVVYPSAYGMLQIPHGEHVRVGQTLLLPFHDLKTSMPGPAGGVYPGIAPLFVREMGIDWMLSAGGPVYAHPMGPMAGGKAMRDGVVAAAQGKDLREAAKESKELDVAIETWGIYDEDAA